MRTEPLAATSTRRQRMAPAASWQVPTALVTVIRVAADPVARRPIPLKETLEKLELMSALAEPSWALRFWMICGAVVSEGATSHPEEGSTRLTTQFVPVADSTQVAPSESTRLNCTV